MTRRATTTLFLSASLAAPSLADTLTLRNGLAGYVGTVDTFLDANAPDTSRGSSANIEIDLAQGANNELPPAHALLRFNTLFGLAPGRIPHGSVIHSATLTLNTTNAGSGALAHRALSTWDETRTWSTSFAGNGIQPNGVDATPNPSFTIGQNTNAPNIPAGPLQLNVTPDLAAWSAGAPNLGWALLPHSPSGVNGWQFASAEATTAANRPTLTVNYTPPQRLARRAPKNVILFVGDGMGVEAVRAATMTAGAPMSFQSLPHQAFMSHDNVSGAITDSAASATALATGTKVANGVISSASPTDPTPLPTTLEILQSRGKRTGLVNTGTYVTDATPAAFGAHNIARADSADIASDFFTQSRPNVLIGRPAAGITPAAAQSAGYTVLTTPAQLQSLNTTTLTHVSGQFPAGSEPALSLSSTKALDLLSHGPDGLFLLVEDENPDGGAHSNDISVVVPGVRSLSAAVQAALTFAASHPDTLIVVTADHETGGLYGLVDNGVGNLPTASWTTTGHTGQPVGLFATGVNADLVRGTLDNTDIFHLLTLSETAWKSDADGAWTSPDNWSQGLPATHSVPAHFLATTTAPRTVTLDSPTTVGSLHFDSPQPYTLAGPATLTLHDTITPPAITVTRGSHTLAALVTSAAPLALTIADGASLDITTNTLLLATPADTLRQYLRNNQLITSTPDPTNTHSLAYLDTGSSTLVKLTYTGDANLDGALNADDYALLDRGFATNGSVWHQGDFNYDGQVTSADYLLIDTTLLSQAPGFSPGFLAHRESQFGPDYVSQLLTAIPEPSALLSALCFLLSSPLRRRRNHRHLR